MWYEWWHPGDTMWYEWWHNVVDQYVTNTRPTHDLYMTNTRQIRNKSTINTRPTHDKYMTNTRSLVTSTWQIQSSTRPIHDKCTINTDQYMTNTRLIHDQYMIKLASCMVYHVTYVLCCTVQNITARDYQNVRQLRYTVITIPRNYTSARHS
jgi:hypothetical protein